MSPVGDVSKQGGLPVLRLAVALTLVSLIVHALTVRGTLPGSAATPARAAHDSSPESSNQVLLLGDIAFHASRVLSCLGTRRTRY
ncbi:hypothetical protein [Streptomyces sp. NPDC127084]|uniref:hypothetical protein n=1 Tax=Streptomyces sp. NPDC127084 TaxID=3347133 RepID=UPI0036546652